MAGPSIEKILQLLTLQASSVQMFYQQKHNLASWLIIITLKFLQRLKVSSPKNYQQDKDNEILLTSYTGKSNNVSYNN